MYSLAYILVAALVSHAPISALKEFAPLNTDWSSSSSIENEYITLWCTWMVHMITYTNVLTPMHSSNSTGVPRPDVGVERVRTSKH